MKGRHWYNRNRDACLKTIEVTYTSNVGFFVYGYESSGSINGREFPDFPVTLLRIAGQDLLILVVSRQHKTTVRSR